jgi:hypothetical protein
MRSYFGIKVKRAVVSPEVEARIREIVREELDDRKSEAVGLTIGRHEFGRAVVNAVNELQRKSGNGPLNI